MSMKQYIHPVKYNLFSMSIAIASSIYIIICACAGACMQPAYHVHGGTISASVDLAVDHAASIHLSVAMIEPAC